MERSAQFLSAGFMVGLCMVAFMLTGDPDLTRRFRQANQNRTPGFSQIKLAEAPRPAPSRVAAPRLASPRPAKNRAVVAKRLAAARPILSNRQLMTARPRPLVQARKTRSRGPGPALPAHWTQLSERFL